MESAGNLLRTCSEVVNDRDANRLGMYCIVLMSVVLLHIGVGLPLVPSCHIASVEPPVRYYYTKLGLAYIMVVHLHTLMLDYPQR